MLNLLILLGLFQAAPATTAPSDESYYAEDPFAIETEQSPRLVPAETVAAEPPPAEPSAERIICRSRPELGSRTRYQRVCLTASQWAEHRNNMEQQRRDINDWGAQGMPPQ